MVFGQNLKISIPVKMIPLERGSQEEQSDTNFSFVAPSIEQSSPLEVMSVQRKTMVTYYPLVFGFRSFWKLKSSISTLGTHSHMHVRAYSNTFDILRVM